MELKFKHQGDSFLVEGSVDTTTLKQFKNHLEFLLLYCKSLKLNMDGLKKLDPRGVEILKELYKASIISRKTFLIIGKNSRKISKYFKAIKEETLCKS